MADPRSNPLLPNAAHHAARDAGAAPANAALLQGNQVQGPLFPPQPQLVRHPKTFAELYSDPNQDPLRCNYPAVLTRFEVMREDPEEAEEILASALSNTALPNTYLCCATLTNGQARIYVIHKLSKFPRSFAGTETPWDDKCFVFLGDMVGETIQSVTIPDTMFRETPQVMVYNEVALAEEVTNLANDAVFPRLAQAHPEAVPIRTRYVMYLPSKYVPLMLKQRGLTPKEAWTRLTPTLQEDGILLEAQPILNWLRASMHATGNNHRGPPITNIELTPPFLDQELLMHRQQVLWAALPEARPTAQLGYDPALMHLAQAVATQATEAREERMARDIEKDRPTMPSAKFSLLFDSLKSFVGVQDEAELPEFWFSLAAASKKQEFSVMRQAFEAYARSPNAFINQAPIPTPKMVSDLTTITLVADHNDDLKTGIQPFVVMDGSEEFRLASLKVAQQYMLLSEQQINIKFSDLSQLDLPKDLRAHPTNFYGLEKSLGLYGNLLGVVLGNQHVLTRNFRTFWKGFRGRFREQLHTEIDDRKYIKPVHLLRNVQLITVQWFHGKRAGETPADPQFFDILNRIELATYSRPTLPGPLYQLIANRPQAKFPMPALTDQHTVATGVSTLTPMTSILSGQPMVTPSVITTSTSSNSVLSNRTGTYTRNPTADTSLRALIPPGIKITELLGTDDVPVGDDNVPFCLSYHVKGGCFSNCRRKDNHSKTLSPEDKQRLSNWLVDQTAKLRARFAAAP